jgi:hypothetical protein
MTEACCCCQPPPLRLTGGGRTCIRMQSCSSDGVDSSRNVVADGLERFSDAGKLPAQPPWEALSERVICVLAGNPGPYTLNGTNCYLVGTGRRRLLIDSGEDTRGHAQLMHNLEACMAAHGVEGIQEILITHHHHDHYGFAQSSPPAIAWLVHPLGRCGLVARWMAARCVAACCRLPAASRPIGRPGACVGCLFLRVVVAVEGACGVNRSSVVISRARLSYLGCSGVSGLLGRFGSDVPVGGPQLPASACCMRHVASGIR